jgi:hypothetical protein
MKPRVVSLARKWTWALIGMLGVALAMPALVLAQSVCTYTDGSGGVTGVVNTYYRGNANAAAGANSVTVSTTNIQGAANRIAAGDLLLIIQMQGANITTSNNNNYGGNNGTGAGYTTNDGNFVAGYYEYVAAEGAVGVSVTGCTAGAGQICITGAGTGNGLINSYRNNNAGGGQGQDRFQVIRVVQYTSARLDAGLTAVPWDGRSGGVLAVDVSGTATLNGTTRISVDGLGFRGGGGRGLAGNTTALNTDFVNLATYNAHGAKGEGIAGTPRYVASCTGGAANCLTTTAPGGRANEANWTITNTGTEGWTAGSQAKGAPGNAGGGGTDANPSANDQNTGGGGGGNGGAGGIGGLSWSSYVADGGIGGVALPAAVTRIFMGGGGGAGSRNNSVDPESSGGVGGGIVILRVGSFTINSGATITANGLTPPYPDNDGGGGGGAGGTLLVVAASGGLTGLTVQAQGVVGANAWPTSAPGTPGPPPTPNPADTRHGPGGGGGGGVVSLSSAATSVNVTGGAAGTTTSSLSNYGATAGAAGVSQTNATFDSIPGVQTCLAVTRATIRGLRVNADSVEFATGQQRRTLGFNLYALETPTRQATGRPLNDRLILAPVPDSVRPILYRVETGPVVEPYLLIEEIEVGGRHRTMGPFDVGDGVLRRAYEAAASRVLSGDLREVRGARMSFPQRAATQATPGRVVARALATPGRSAQGVKIEVVGPGRVVVPLSELVAAGVPPAWAASPQRLQLTNLGRPVPFAVVRAPQGQPQAIAFDAEELSTDYTGRNVYVVSWGNAVPRLDVSLTRSGFPRQPGLTRVERNVVWVPFLVQGADPWIWDYLTTGMGPVIETFDLPGLPAGLSGDVPVRVGLVGRTNHTHRVWANLNGVDLGMVRFQGETMAWLSGQVPATVLSLTGNELTLTYEADLSATGDEGLVFLDVVDLGVRLVPGTPSYELVGFDPSLPSFGGTNYLIVTHALFRSQAERIAALKAAEGLRPVVVDVEHAYDRFAAGVFEAQAVRELIRQVARQTKLEYVLLVGGDTFDPRGFSDTPDLVHVSYIPSLTGWDGEFGRVPSEKRYADLNGDGRPDVAIGWLPVRTVEQAEALVDKIARQGELLRASLQPPLFVVDKPGVGDIAFRAEAEKAAARLGSGEWVDLSTAAVGPAHDALMAGLRAGHLTTHYFGHGAWDQWSNEQVLTVPDAESLAGTGHGTVLFTWTCNAQWYLDDQGPSVNEALLLAPGGGALASVGPTGETDPALQVQLAARLYAKLLAGLPLGEALRQAEAEALKANPQMQPVVEGWSLLGDPALRLPLTPRH